MTVEMQPKLTADRPGENNHSSGTIQQDLFCAGCRYNMRGINVGSRCPECGLPIANTLVALLERAGATIWKPPLDAKQLGSIRDGLVLMLLGSLTWAILLVMPSRMFAFRTTERAIMLGIACTAWVLNATGMWKTAARLFAPRQGIRDPNPVLRRLLRVVAATVLFVPIACELAFDTRQPFINADLDFLATPTAVATVAAVFLIGPLLFLRINRIARCVEAQLVAGASALIACLWPVGGFIMLELARFGRYEVFNSLEFLSFVPLPPSGPVVYWREVVREFYWRHSPEYLLVLLPSLLGVASLSVILLCCAGVWRDESHDSCRAQIFRTIGITCGTSSGFAGRISIRGFYHNPPIAKRKNPAPGRDVTLMIAARTGAR